MRYQLGGVEIVIRPDEGLRQRGIDFYDALDPSDCIAHLNYKRELTRIGHQCTEPRTYRRPPTLEQSVAILFTALNDSSRLVDRRGSTSAKPLLRGRALELHEAMLEALDFRRWASWLPQMALAKEERCNMLKAEINRRIAYYSFLGLIPDDSTHLRAAYHLEAPVHTPSSG